MKEDKGWHQPAKHLNKTTEGTCPYCKKHVKALEAHIHDKHKKEMHAL